MTKMKLQNPTSPFALWPLFLHAILLYFVSFLQPNSTIVNALSNETDRLALLKFKESISNDPHGVMSSWNDSIHFCSWPGISCGRRHQRITALNLKGYDLRGSMSPYIGNLFDVENNSFFGEIPPQVSHLRRLQHLNLSVKSLEGKIPVNLSYCSKLRILRLRQNKLNGSIPSNLGSLVELVHLHLAQNNLTGVIPASLGNISSLSEFYVPINNLVGTIPHELGRLKRLTIFSIGDNNLSGEIPLSIYNISSMRGFSILKNHFKGTLPPNIGLTLPNLQIFSTSLNDFSGTIPYSFVNATQLQMFVLGANKIFGQVPASLGNLPYLRHVNFTKNILGNHSTNSLEFIESLTNCSQLEILALGANNFGGVLPKSIANLWTKLTRLYLGSNQISGNIPVTGKSGQLSVVGHAG